MWWRRTNIARGLMRTGRFCQMPGGWCRRIWLVVYKIYMGNWFFGRPTLEELRQDLRAVLKKCRPDWDITGAELMAAGCRGEKDRFYRYGKSYIKTIIE